MSWADIFPEAVVRRSFWQNKHLAYLLLPDMFLLKNSF
jgi:hypothetical protein